MPTVWKRLGEVGAVFSGASIVLSGLGLLFGYVFESAYYASFGVEIADHASHGHLAGAAFRHPLIFLWTVPAAFVFFVNLRVLYKAYKAEASWIAWKEALLLVAVLYLSWLWVSDHARKQAASLRAIEIAADDPARGAQALLLIGTIESEIVVCDPATGAVSFRRKPDAWRYLPAGPTEVNAEHCYARSNR